MPEFDAVDLDYAEIPYNHYIVDDWPVRGTNIRDSGVAREQLVTDGSRRLALRCVAGSQRNHDAAPRKQL